jgi:hypothetical protein
MTVETPFWESAGAKRARPTSPILEVLLVEASSTLAWGWGVGWAGWGGSAAFLGTGSCGRKAPAQ